MVRRRLILDPNQFPPVEYASGLEGFASPEFIPGNPHNLPPNGNRPPLRQFDANAPLIAPSVDLNNLPSINPPPSESVDDPWHRAEVIENFILVVATTADPNAQLFLNRPPGKRNFLLLRNATATGNIFIGNGNAASANSPIILTPGQMILLDTVVPQGDLYAFASAGATSLAFGYSNIP